MLPSVKFIVTVVVFQLLLLVTLLIPLPVSPLSHLGIVKSNTTSPPVPVFTTLALVPAPHVVVLHTLTTDPLGIVKFNITSPSTTLSVTLALLQGFQVEVVPALTIDPLGIVKSNIASFSVPTFSTLALVQGLLVVVVPTLTVAASPLGHLILLPSGFKITTPYLVGSSVLLTTLNLLVVSLSWIFVTLFVIPT